MLSLKPPVGPCPLRLFPALTFLGAYGSISHPLFLDFSFLASRTLGNYSFISVQSLSHVRLFVTPWTTAHQASLSITNSHSLLKLMSIESVMPSNHLILSHPLLLLPSIFPSIRIFPNESALGIRWPKYWIFSFNISPSNEHPGLISFRMDWLDLLEVQGTLKSLLQHHSWKASIPRCLAFFAVQEMLKSLLQHHSWKASIPRCSAFCKGQKWYEPNRSRRY